MMIVLDEGFQTELVNSDDVITQWDSNPGM